MNKKKEASIKKDTKKASKEEKKEAPEKEAFDFGGFPEGISLKRNMGCGG